MNEAMLHATFAGKLPDLWIVDVSESGYMDEKVFRKCVGQLSKLRRVDALGNKEKICAILDGHYSHMDADLWKQALEEEGIFCFIIAAHTSVLTQVGDNGPNSVLKSLYDVYLEEVKMQIGGLLKMDVSLFNEVFRRTWQWACNKYGMVLRLQPQIARSCSRELPRDSFAVLRAQRRRGDLGAGREQRRRGQSCKGAGPFHSAFDRAAFNSRSASCAGGCPRGH